MAKQFQFRLEAVRRVRQQAQDAQQRVVARVLREAAAIESRIHQRTAELRDQVDATRTDQQHAQLDVVHVRRDQYHQTWLQQQILLGQSELAAKQQELAAERRTLAEAAKQVKVIEKLRDRQQQRWEEAVRRAEQRENDEIGTQRFFQRRGPALTPGVESA